MKTRQYESVLIINAALEDPQIESTLGRVKEIISSFGGEINDFETWGRKRLSYPIRKAKTGYYVIYRYIKEILSDPEIMKDLKKAEEDFKKGRYSSWEEVRKKLGFKEEPKLILRDKPKKKYGKKRKRV